jgi:hypothetical protein
VATARPECLDRILIVKADICNPSCPNWLINTIGIDRTGRCDNSRPKPR